MYIYLTCLADAVAVSFVRLSAAGFVSDWLERTVVSDWTVYCCLVISVVVVTHGEEEQESEDATELCSGVDSVLGDVEVTSWGSFSDDCSSVSVEAESFAGHGGVGVESEAVSVAGDCGVLSGSFVSDWLGLCCESGMTAGSWLAVC